MNILTNNCMGGNVYRDILMEEYKNPFIWTLFNPDDFIDFIESYHNIDFSKYELGRHGKKLENNFYIKLDDRFIINETHKYFDAKYNTPTKVGFDIRYNKIWTYILELFEKRLERMKNETENFVIFWEPTLPCSKLSKLPDAIKKSHMKGIIFTDDKNVKSNECVKVVYITKQYKTPGELLIDYGEFVKKEITKYIH